MRIQAGRSEEHPPRRVWGVLATSQAIVVDNDVDIHDSDKVEWAVATRFQGDTDLVAVHKAQGSKLDPSTCDGVGSKLGYDATVPHDAPEFKYTTIRVPGKDDIDLDAKVASDTSLKDIEDFNAAGRCGRRLSRFRGLCSVFKFGGLRRTHRKALDGRMRTQRFGCRVFIGQFLLAESPMQHPVTNNMNVVGRLAAVRFWKPVRAIDARSFDHLPARKSGRGRESGVARACQPRDLRSG